MAITRTAWTDDDGTGTTGTILNNAQKTSLYDQIDGLIGEWTDVAFSAGNFTGNGSMTWTLASGDASTNRYVKHNKTLTWSVFLITTSVGGTPSTDLQIAVPGGFTFANSGNACHAALVSDNGTIREGIVRPTSGSILSIQLTSGANWAAATNTTTVAFTWVGEVS